MIKHFPFTDYCPTKNKIVSLNIPYLNSSALEDYQPRFIKNQNPCPRNCDNCPIWENAPLEH